METTINNLSLYELDKGGNIVHYYPSLFSIFQKKEAAEIFPWPKGRSCSSDVGKVLSQ